MPEQKKGKKIMVTRIVSLRRLRNIAACLAALGLVVLIGLTCLHKHKQEIFEEETSPPMSAYDRVAYLNLCGLKVDEENFTERIVRIPEEFNEVYDRYNLIQRLQGFDLRRHRDAEVSEYTYSILNFPCGGKYMKATLLVRDGVLIGGDIHSTAERGFMTGLRDETV